MEEEKYLKGVWTPWAQVLCYDCHGNENLPHPKTEEEWARMTQPQELSSGNAVTFCDDCHVPIQVDESVAYEHNLVMALRECGIEAEMYQSGGLASSVSIVPSEELRGEDGPDDVGQILITYSFDGDKAYWVGVYDNDFAPVNAEWAFEGFKTQDEVMSWAFKNQEKLAKLEQPEPKWPELLKTPVKETALASLVNEAKERANERGSVQQREKHPGAQSPER